MAFKHIAEGRHDGKQFLGQLFSQQREGRPVGRPPLNQLLPQLDGGAQGRQSSSSNIEDGGSQPRGTKKPLRSSTGPFPQPDVQDQGALGGPYARYLPFNPPPTFPQPLPGARTMVDLTRSPVTPPAFFKEANAVPLGLHSSLQQSPSTPVVMQEGPIHTDVAPMFQVCSTVPGVDVNTFDKLLPPFPDLVNAGSEYNTRVLSWVASVVVAIQSGYNLPLHQGYAAQGKTKELMDLRTLVGYQGPFPRHETNAFFAKLARDLAPKQQGDVWVAISHPANVLNFNITSTMISSQLSVSFKQKASSWGTNISTIVELYDHTFGAPGSEERKQQCGDLLRHVTKCIEPSSAQNEIMSKHPQSITALISATIEFSKALDKSLINMQTLYIDSLNNTSDSPPSRLATNPSTRGDKRNQTKNATQQYTTTSSQESPLIGSGGSGGGGGGGSGESVGSQEGVRYKLMPTTHPDYKYVVPINPAVNPSDFKTTKCKHCRFAHGRLFGENKEWYACKGPASETLPSCSDAYKKKAEVLKIFRAANPLTEN